MRPAPEDLRLGEASCAIWRDAPNWEGLKTAAIGRFAASSADNGAALLQAAIARLAGEGFQALIGPMDGDTWHSYRLAVESDGQPPFLLEPRSGPHDLAAFVAVGFAPIQRYASSRASVEAALAASPPALGEAFTIRAWDGHDAERFVLRLFEMSRAEFTRAAFFKPRAWSGAGACRRLSSRDRRTRLHPCDPCPDARAKRLVAPLRAIGATAFRRYALLGRKLS